MPQIIKKLTQVKPGEKVIILDRDLMNKLPQLRDKSFVCSTVKYSGRRLFFQYVSPEMGSGILKLNRDIDVEVIETTDMLTLANFLMKNRHKHPDLRPRSIVLELAGKENTYTLTQRFWECNPKNIRIKGLLRGVMQYAVPSSSVVKRILN